MIIFALLDNEWFGKAVAIGVIAATLVVVLLNVVEHLRWKRRTSGKRRGGSL